MSAEVNLAGVAGKDLSFNFALTYQGKTLDLTSLTVTAVVKANRKAVDNTGTTYAVSSGITVTSARRGQFTLDIPRADVSTPGTVWYRVDVADVSGDIAAAIFGALTLIPA